MTKLRLALMAALVLALLAPVTVSAAGVFYCSALISTGGSGTYNYPWACADQAAVDSLIYNTICPVYAGGVLYQILSGGYVRYDVSYLNQQCTYTYARYPGYPPDTGVTLPAPLLVSLAVGAAALLIVAGLWLRRRGTAS